MGEYFRKQLRDSPQFRDAETQTSPSPKRKRAVSAERSHSGQGIRAEILNQGVSPLCSAHAAATAVMASVGAKFGIHFEAGMLLQMWLDKKFPKREQWPDAFLQDTGHTTILTTSAAYDLSCTTYNITSFKKAKDVVLAIAGFRAVIIVMKFQGGSHSVVGIRADSGGHMVCQNSHGPDNRPFVQVHPGNFVTAYLVDPYVTCKHTTRERTFVRGPPGTWETVPQQNLRKRARRSGPSVVQTDIYDAIRAKMHKRSRPSLFDA